MSAKASPCPTLRPSADALDGDVDFNDSSSQLSSPPVSLPDEFFPIRSPVNPVKKSAVSNEGENGPNLMAQLKAMEEASAGEDAMRLTKELDEEERNDSQVALAFAKGDSTGKATGTNRSSDDSPAAKRTELLRPLAIKGRKGKAKVNAQAQAAARRRQQNEAKKWAAPFVFTDSKSPLAGIDVDLRSILLQPRAWDVLTPQERQDVLAKFPANSGHITSDADGDRPDQLSLSNDDTFRFDCTRYEEAIRQGRHDKQWLHDAWVAHAKRKRGGFDEYMVDKFETEYGESLPDDRRPKRARVDWEGSRVADVKTSSSEVESSAAEENVVGTWDSSSSDTENPAVDLTHVRIPKQSVDDQQTGQDHLLLTGDTLCVRVAGQSKQPIQAEQAKDGEAVDLRKDEASVMKACQIQQSKTKAQASGSLEADQDPSGPPPRQAASLDAEPAVTSEGVITAKSPAAADIADVTEKHTGQKTRATKRTRS